MSEVVTVSETGGLVAVTEASETEVTIAQDAEPAVVNVVTAGPQGPPGSTVGADAHYEQPFTALSLVTVSHNLGKKPAVTVIDSAGDEVEGDVEHVSDNQLIVSFSSAFSGRVLVN